MDQLPSELVIQIIKELALPNNDRAYAITQDAMTTLCQLSLTSHVLWELCRPHLYERAVVKPSNIASFCRTIVQNGQHNRRAPFSATELGLRVKSLALLHFDEEPTMAQTRHIASIFYALGPTLERLFMDVFLRQVDYASPLENDLAVSLKDATRRLSNLEEFCRTEHLPWNMDPMPWASGRTLKRVALLSVSLHYKLVDSFSTLANVEEAVIAFPILSGTQRVGAHMDRIFEVIPRMKEFLLVGANYPIYSRGFRAHVGEFMESPEMASELDGRSERVKVVEVMELQPFQVDHREGWFTSHVLSGQLWSLEGKQAWREYASLGWGAN